MWDKGIFSSISNGPRCPRASSRPECETQNCWNIGVLICRVNPTPSSPARKLTDWLAVIDYDIYKGPGDTHCSDVGCDVTGHQVLIETPVKHRIRFGAPKKCLFKTHPVDFSFTKETLSIDVFPSRQELYLNRFFFPFPLDEIQFSKDEDWKNVELILSFTSDCK